MILSLFYRICREAVLSLLLLGVGATELAADTGAAARPQPNILYIMLDDAGYADFSDPEVITPNIDRLTSEGMRFEKFYTAPSCGPTRFSMLTGANPLRFGLNHPIFPKSVRGIPEYIETLPEALRTAGYETVHIGKWHIGTRREEYLPTGLGFDYTVRYDLAEDGGGNTDFIDPKITINEDPATTRTIKGHKTNILTDFVIYYLNRRSVADRPFFLNLWYNAPHAPSQPSSYWAARYPNTVQGKHHAFVSHVDEQIGRILDTLDATGLATNTIVLLTSDNGGSKRWPLSNLPFRDGKRSLFEGGIRLPLLVRWPGVGEPGRVDLSTLAIWDIAPTLADISGADPGRDFEDGQSFLPILRGEIRNVSERPAPLYWAAKLAAENDRARHGNEGYAIQDGNWKFIANPERTYLFDLAIDPSETMNLVSRYPDRAAALRQRFQLWKLLATQVAHQPALGGSATESKRFFWNPQVGELTFTPDTLLNFHDGDFTAAVQLLPLAHTGRVQNILRKPGSWSLSLDPQGRLRLLVQGEKRAETLTTPNPLAPGVPHAVAFTVYRHIPGQTTIRLYAHPLNHPEPMSPVAEAGQMGHVASSDAAVTIGGAGDTEFAGELERLSFHLLRLTPDELETLLRL